MSGGNILESFLRQLQGNTNTNSLNNNSSSSGIPNINYINNNNNRNLQVNEPNSESRPSIDISMLKKQYKKLKQRQKQAQVILSGKSSDCVWNNNPTDIFFILFREFPVHAQEWNNSNNRSQGTFLNESIVEWQNGVDQVQMQKGALSQSIGAQGPVCKYAKRGCVCARQHCIIDCAGDAYGEDIVERWPNQHHIQVWTVDGTAKNSQTKQ